MANGWVHATYTPPTVIASQLRLQAGYAASRLSIMTGANCINTIRIHQYKGHGNHRNIRKMRHMFTHIFCGQTTRRITSQREGGGSLFHTLMHGGEGGGCFPYFMVVSGRFSILPGEKHTAQKKGMEPWKAQQNAACKAQDHRSSNTNDNRRSINMC